MIKKLLICLGFLSVVFGEFLHPKCYSFTVEDIVNIHALKLYYFSHADLQCISQENLDYCCAMPDIFDSVVAERCMLDEFNAKDEPAFDSNESIESFLFSPPYRV